MILARTLRERLKAKIAQQDKKRADRLICPTPACGSGARVAAAELESETRESGKWCAAS